MSRRAPGRRVNRSPATGHRIWLRRLVLPSLVLLVIASGVAIVLATSPPTIPVTPRSGGPPSLGDPNAPVVIVEYADFQCPFCGAFAREVKPQLEAAYIDTGRVRFEWRDFAWMGRESTDAAQAARCAADQGRFWEYHDRLYAAAVAPNSGTFSRERLLADAEALDLDASAFAACLDDGRYEAAVQAETASAAQMGLTGTPTFIIGDQRIVGAQPFEVFAAAIEAAGDAGAR